jgi:glycosyltransferase involved in cell wall biosynthesis
MMAAQGYDVWLYGGSISDWPQTVAVVEGPQTPEVVEPEWTLEYFREMNDNAIAAIRERISPGDLICLIGGNCQQPIAEAFPDNLSVEFGIGYEGTFSSFRVFESAAWMHAVYAAQQGGAMAANGRFYDAVIPNYFDVDQFPAGKGDGGYLLFMARLIERKGIQIAVDVSKRTGIPLKIAGQGEPPDHGEYMGVVGPEERAELMGNAIAVLAPTLYVGPFEGVAVEAQITGTPVICTDFGAFRETVVDGVTGYRCHTQPEFDAAALKYARMGYWESTHMRAKIRKRAIDLYSMETCALMYGDYFDRVSGLCGGDVGDFYGNKVAA